MRDASLRPHRPARPVRDLESCLLDISQEREREEEERRRAKKAKAMAKLEGQKYNLLQKLLERTEMYSSFLTEQLYAKTEGGGAKNGKSKEPRPLDATMQVEKDLREKARAAVRGN